LQDKENEISSHLKAQLLGEFQKLQGPDVLTKESQLRFGQLWLIAAEQGHAEE
jgi:hypothetical protein